MVAKPSKLGAFVPGKQPPAPPAPAALAAPTVVRKQGGGRGNLAGREHVALTLKVHRSTWQDLHALAISRGSSISALALEGLALVAEREGLPLRLPEP